MEEDLISMIVPVYNVEKYLVECVESIIHQTYKNLEIILVDDGSTDDSGKICDDLAKKDNRIRVIHKPNGGLSDARNAGIKVSTGNYIQFIDSDDYIDSDTVEFLLSDLKKHDADISIASHYVFDEEECSNQSTGAFYVFNRLEALQQVLLDDKIRSYAWSKLYKKQLFEEVQFPKGRLFEDALTIPKLFEKSNKVVFHDVAKYYYRQRKGSILHVQTKQLRLDYIEAQIEISKFLMEKENSLFLYCMYNYLNVTLNTYNDIGLFNMHDILEDATIQKLYENLCKIFTNQTFETFIVEHSSFVKKLHLYYLIADKNNYLTFNKQLPALHPVWKN